jgi:AcrR family transcriptional regulator
MSAELEYRQQQLRDRILAATSRVVSERGVAGTRMSAIASAAECAEGSIYRYFAGKQELLEEVLRARLAEPVDALHEFAPKAGSATVRANLREAARSALHSYRELVPLAAAVFADAELQAAQRELLEGGNLDPHTAAASLADYLRAEQELGRVRAGADTEVAARTLLDSCFGRSFVGALLDRYGDEEERDRYADELVELVARGLEPA